MAALPELAEDQHWVAEDQILALLCLQWVLCVASGSVVPSLMGRRLRWP